MQHILRVLRIFFTKRAVFSPRGPQMYRKSLQNVFRFADKSGIGSLRFWDITTRALFGDITACESRALLGGGLTTTRGRSLAIPNSISICYPQVTTSESGGNLRTFEHIMAELHEDRIDSAQQAEGNNIRRGQTDQIARAVLCVHFRVRYSRQEMYVRVNRRTDESITGRHRCTSERATISSSFYILSRIY